MIPGSTGIGAQGTDDDLAERGLAATALPHQTQAFTLVHRQIDTVQRPDRADTTAEALFRFQVIGFGDVLQFQQRLTDGDLTALSFGSLCLCRLLTTERATDLDRTQRLQTFIAVGTDHRHCLEQCLQIGVGRMIKDPLNSAALHNLAAIGDGHVIGHIGDHAEIMGNHQDRHAEITLQIPDQRQYLRLNGDIECGGRLIGNQQRRLANQRHGDHGTLAQPAGQFKRILMQCP